MVTNRQRSRPVVAIDGPAGAGKSTVAAHLASRFGFLNLETGAMYRAFALKALEGQLDLDHEAVLLGLTDVTTIRLEPTTDGNRVLLDGRDVTAQLRDPEVTVAASRISVHPGVRTWMVKQQQALGAAGGVVMEGRDIGTVVFPDAEIKIFLDAEPEMRGERRFRQGGAALVVMSEAEVIADMKARDERDRTRVESPLRPAPDAMRVDSTELTLSEVLQRCELLVVTALQAQQSLQVASALQQVTEK